MAALADAVLSKYEITDVVSARIQQVCNGGALFVTRLPGETIPAAVRRELLERKTPLLLMRTLPDGTQRKYRVRDMVIRKDLLHGTSYHV